MIITTKQHKLLMSQEQIKTADAITRGKIMHEELIRMIEKNKLLEHRLENQARMLKDRPRAQDGKYVSYYEGSF